MNTQFELSSHFADLDLEQVIKGATGQSVDLHLDSLFQMAGIDAEYRTADPLKTAINGHHHDAVKAAFAAGLACGLDPERLLLARLSAAVDRLEDAVDRLDGEA